MPDYSIQLFSSTIILILLYHYLRMTKLPLRSTKIFSVFLVLTSLCLIMDICTLTLLYNMEEASEFVLRLSHQIFIGLINAVIFCLFFYVKSLLDIGHDKWHQKILYFAPFILSMIVIVIAPIEYHIGSDGRYSYGVMANTVYINCAYYILQILILLYLRRKPDSSFSNALGYISNAKCFSITGGIVIWIGCAVIQFFNPTELISSMGISLMVLFVFLSFENPVEFADTEIGTLNRRAYHIMVSEYFTSKRTFFHVNIVFSNLSHVNKSLGHDESWKLISDISSQIKKLSSNRIYHSRSNTLSIFFEKKSEMDTFITKFSNEKFSLGYSKISPILNTIVIRCPDFADNSNELYNLSEHMINTVKNEPSPVIIYCNEDTLAQKVHYESIIRLVESSIEKKAFDVVYQPILDVRSKKFKSAEALVRLQNTGSLGYISPEIFIPIAEEKGLIDRLGLIIFEKVCIFISKNNISEMGIEYIEVNLSAIQCIDSEIFSSLNRLMKKYGVDPKAINLEITETAAVDGLSLLYSNMDKLRNIGCHFSMDDFGTGYSNLSQIAQVHFDLIKLDKSLIWPCFSEAGESSLIILNSCIDMILKLGIKIVAEGVETEEQARYLIEKNVDYLQGYLYSRPLNDADFISFIKQNNQ